MIRDSIVFSDTKPIYVTQVLVKNGGPGVVLSDTFYENILYDVISNPVKSVQDVNLIFQNIRNNLILSGLYKNVDVKLDLDERASLLNHSLKLSTEQIGIESVVPISATLNMTPLYLTPYKNYVTFNTSNTQNSVSLNRDWINLFGTSDTGTIKLSADLNQTKSEIDKKSIDAKFTMPLLRNSSIRTILESKCSIAKPRNDTMKQFELNIGLTKLKLIGGIKSLPIFYSGLNIQRKQTTLGPLSDEESETEIIGNISDEVINSLSLKSEYITDSRFYTSKFPSGGHLFKLVHQHVLNETNSISNEIKKNISNINMSFEKHISTLNDQITSSFIFDGHVGVPLQSTFANLNSGEFWDNEKEIFKTLCQNDIKVSHKVGLVSSFRVPNIPITSPIRFQLSVLGINKSKRMAEYLKNYSADTGVSLVYKGDHSQMKLSYQIPLIHGNDNKHSGLSFDVAVTYC
ncbi:hypothetical protein TPHA_0E01750 [Tetrapisispora phaffii CBS 4417]|uniref:Bacterial surface antigen (D15) domain-containing protein n=1 Tax=Tetrapisispora phaffii (strain ATCC 24235 / CBS 4417 / NBRC 1672 / NRRL Y-8282 / UCD 70-5) TaxID=1071381 RepID=G8BTP0_TETPH|nr:hypothetical protein TPHA_0E01750 [Tetrapisispora phaffii CBS 4417]CCE63268.1 hypothetical protein TPHA_0E01750 [Tetrapisispora phaffii CBS 4417]